MLREGQLPEAPPVLQGQPIEIEYVSPLARAQRQSELQSILRLLEISFILSVEEGFKFLIIFFNI